MKYGLIGYPLSHSFSQRYFGAKFVQEKIAGCSYENFEISSISQLPHLISSNTDLQGFNITIPYKQQVIPFLHHQHKIVESTGACNCVRIIQNRLYGFNTDVAGFEQSLISKLKPHHNKALVLGTGGASKAVAYVLDSLGISFIYVSRNKRHKEFLKYEEVSDEILGSHTLIINTTPTGMFPHVEEAPSLNYNALSSRHYLFDLVYNPQKTRFLQMGEEKGAAIQNGYDMLVIQAEESWKIWTAQP